MGRSQPVTDQCPGMCGAATNGGEETKSHQHLQSSNTSLLVGRNIPRNYRNIQHCLNYLLVLIPIYLPYLGPMDHLASNKNIN